MISFVCVGRVRERFYADGVSCFLSGRNKHSDPVRVIEVPDESAPEGLSDAQKRQIIEKEGEAVLRRINTTATVVALDINGAKYTEAEINGIIRKHPDVAFVIGGSLGLGQNVLERADYRWSLSAMTLPHQLARVVCLAIITKKGKI